MKENPEVNPFVLQFLEAESYQEKQVIFQKESDKMTKKDLENIALSMDMILSDFSQEELIQQIWNQLRTLQKFEINRPKLDEKW
ncbi:hypothetical protein FACS189418_4430 [Clostridia bacterium]|nr:hypothetical protein FACS189418_4430 [Clostridia bacterium]